MKSATSGWLENLHRHANIECTSGRCGMPVVFAQGIATSFKQSPQMQGASSQCGKDLDW